MFCWYFKRLSVFLAQCGYCVDQWKILGIVEEGVNNETRILLQYWDFIVKILMKHEICLNRLLGTHLSLKRLVAFVDILFPILVHFMLDLIMLLVDVTCVVLLIIILFHVHSMHAILNLIHPFL